VSEIQDLRDEVRQLTEENALLLHKAQLAQSWARTHYKAFKKMEAQRDRYAKALIDRAKGETR